MLRTSHVKPEGLQRSWRVNRKPFVMQKSSSSQQNWQETTDKLSWCTFLATNSFKTNFGIGNISYRKLSSKHFILLALPIGKFFFGKKHIAVLHWLTLTSQPARRGLLWRCDSALRLYLAWQTKHGSHKAAECGWFVSKFLGNLSWFRGIYNIFIIIINPMLHLLRWQPSYWRSCCWFGSVLNIKIAGKWMFTPLKMVLIGIDPYPFEIWAAPRIQPDAHKPARFRNIPLRQLPARSLQQVQKRRTKRQHQPGSLSGAFEIVRYIYIHIYIYTYKGFGCFGSI